MALSWKTLFSENIKPYKGYAIGKLFKLLHDPEIISLAGGLPSPDTFPIDRFRNLSGQRLREDIDRIMQYTDIVGESELVEAVIQFLAKDDIRVSAENVLITSSGQQGLDVTGRLFLDPGDAVLVDRPSFAGALISFEMQRPLFAGVDIKSDGSDTEGFRDEVESLMKRQRKPKFIYVVPDFQNPSGITMQIEKRIALLDLSHDHGIPIVEDSPYRHLRYSGDTVPSLFTLDQQRGGGHVIGIYTFSKLFCPGMRVGFNIGPKMVIEKMTNIKEGSTLNTPKYNQDLCTAFLKEMDWQEHVEKCRSYYGQKLNVLLEALDSHFPREAGISWTRPDGGMFVWVTLPEHVDTLALFHEAVAHKVAFVPGHVFFAENPVRNQLRINFSFPAAAQLTEAVKRLSRCIAGHL